MSKSNLPDGREWPLFYAIMHILVWWVKPLVARLHVEGLENVPREGPVILALNHIAWVDVPLVAVSLARVTHYMAKIELFQVPVLGTLMRWLGAFQVRRGEGDRDALRSAQRILSEGKILVVFPEGHRSGTGHLAAGHPGVAYIALRSGVPIVPVAISGTERALKGFHYGPWAPRVTISFGKPFHLDMEGKGRRRETLALAADQIMREIARLLPPEYRGAYADLDSTAVIAHAEDAGDEEAPAPPPQTQSGSKQPDTTAAQP